MFILSRKLFFTKFRAYFHDASDILFPKINGIFFSHENPVNINFFQIYREKTKMLFFEAVKIKLKQFYDYLYIISFR